MSGRLFLAVLFFTFKVMLCETTYASEPVIINDTKQSYPLGLHLEILEDNKKKWTFEEVISEDLSKKFTKSRQDAPGYGFTKSAYWSRFTIKSNSNNRDWMLELDYPLMDKVDLYIPVSDKKYTVKKSGYKFPFSQREIKHRNFVFKLDIPYGESRTFYMRFENEDRMEFPLILWSKEGFYEKDHNEQYVFGVYYGMLLVIFLYNFIMFFFIKDRSYIYYIVFIFCYALYQLTQNGLAFEYFWPGFLSSHYIALIDSLLFIAGIQFTQSFLSTDSNTPLLDKILLILKLIFIIPIAISFLGNYTLSIEIVVILIFITISFVIFTGMKCLLKRYRPAGYFIFAWVTILIGGMIYGMRVMALIPINFFTTYALQIGSIMQITFFSLGLGDKIIMMRKDKSDAETELINTQRREFEKLEKANKEIAEANKLILLSESKYKSIVESSEDIIFSLDKKWHFISVNKAIKTHLKISPEKIISTPFLDLIYSGSEIGSANAIAKQIIKDKLENFADNRESINFTTDFFSQGMIEPREMQVRLEYINIEGKNEILGKASSVHEDSLLKYFQSEAQSFAIANFLVTAEDISYRLTKNLNKYMDARDITLVRVSLREIIINAIEHGNLNISFEEKSKAMLEGTYLDLIASRQRNPKNVEKRVQIEYSINSKRMACKITDDGQGFDHQKLLNNDVEDLNNRMVPHGRGVTMARNVFDEIKYNSKGNQVLLVKFFI